MNLPSKRNHYWPLILTIGLFAAALITAHYFNIVPEIFIPLCLILGLLAGAMGLWAFANQKADGSEWWQDDEASGWRGY
ncbi:MAG: hypothetical protein KJ063_23805 [Anaerolineae bacterium]|nr:hypothetical protein [Anaerolineae bacterium]